MRIANRIVVITSAALFFGSAPSLAQPDTEISSKDDGDKKDKKGKKSNKDKKPKLKLSGRLFVRDSVQRVDAAAAEWTNDFAISSARLKADYKASQRVSTKIRVELAGKNVRLKDVYVRVQDGPFRMDVGRFKRPVSAIAIESAWRLPVVERGALNEELLANGNEVPLPFSGRAEGVLARYRPNLPLKVTLTAALMNSRLPEESGGDDAFLPANNMFRDGFVRVAVKPVKGLEIAAGGSYIGRVADAAGRIDQILGGSVDVTLKKRWGRVWLEGFYGQTPYVDALMDDAHGNIMAARALVAPRVYRSKGWLRSVEVFGLANFVDLSSDLSRHWTLETGGGVAARFAQQWRIQVQVVRRTSGAAYPMAGLDQGYLQLGSVF